MEVGEVIQEMLASGRVLERKIVRHKFSQNYYQLLCRRVLRNGKIQIIPKLSQRTTLR